MRYNDRRFSIEGGAGLMGKYQLKSRKEGSVITLLEVDTECRAWYVKADDKDAAVKTLNPWVNRSAAWSPSTSTGMI